VSAALTAAGVLSTLFIVVDVVGWLYWRHRRRKTARARYRAALREVGRTHFGIEMIDGEDEDDFRARCRAACAPPWSAEWRRQNPNERPYWLPEDKWNEKPN
jgi:hypothetical protein